MGVNVDTAGIVSDTLRQFVIAGATEIASSIVLSNNEGLGDAPPAPKDTQELRGSVRLTVGTPAVDADTQAPYPLLTEADVKRDIQLLGFSAGETLFLTWLADHANLIEGGRRPDKNGRMIGSEQAPEGWVAPAIDATAFQMPNWRFQP